jgi:LytS/YehU family sensor histidine kinase
VQISIYLSEYTESNIQMLKGLYAYSTIATFFSCVYSLSHYSNSYISVKEEKQRLELALMEEKEKALQAQLMSLKLQINPHFIFNNHNILEELISKDPLTAKKFLQSMSSFYRYIIGNIESDTIQIGKEIEFIEAYIQLLKIRYGESVIINISNELRETNGLIPPVSLQILIENAIKHNSRSISSPLQITINKKDEYIVVSNRLQPLLSAPISTGIGHQNLMKRYELLSKKRIIINIRDNSYNVYLPIIQAHNEDIGNRR